MDWSTVTINFAGLGVIITSLLVVLGVQWTVRKCIKFLNAGIR